MHGKQKGNISPDQDLKFVKQLIAKNELDGVLARLDSDNIAKTLDAVPLEVIRIVAVLLSDEKENILTSLPSGQAAVAKKIIESAEQHGGRQFLPCLVKAMRANKRITERLGVELADSGAAREEKRDFNAVGNIRWAPQLMLASNRVYVDIVFLRQDEILFKSKVELDDLLVMANSLAKAAVATLEFLNRDHRGIIPNLRTDRCETGIKVMRLAAANLSSELRRLARRRPKPKKNSRQQKASRKARRAAGGGAN